MEFRNLKKQYLYNRKAIDLTIQEVLLGGNFIGGEPVNQLEKKLADYVGVKHCITCGNGTDALQLALMAWGIGAGDAVFVPDFTFFSTAEVVPWVDATPVFVDVDKDTFNLSVNALEEAIQNVIREGKLVPRVVIAVDLFGQPADFPKIRKITQKYNMLLLEDGAQGFGGKIGDKKACGFGDISTTSFFPAKPLGCYGDGGAVFTNNDEWAELIRSYKVHGKGENKYDNIRIGLNSRLDTIQAAVLNIKLDKFEEETKLVNYWADMYAKKLGGIVKCPIVSKGFYSSWAQYTILFEDSEQRDYVQKELKKYDIPTMIYYAKGIHQQKALSKYLDADKDYPVTEAVCKKCLSLPMHPYLTEEDIDFIVNKLCSSIKNM